MPTLFGCSAAAGPSWLQDPGVELEPEITLITGLANHHLVGKQIDDSAASALLDRAGIFPKPAIRFRQLLGELTKPLWWS